MGDNTDVLLQTIKYVTDKSTNDLSYNKTVTCTIMKNYGEGRYLVREESITYEAYGENTKYPLGAEVYVIIPNNNYESTKYILGRNPAVEVDGDYSFSEIITNENTYGVSKPVASTNEITATKVTIPLDDSLKQYIKEYKVMAMTYFVSDNLYKASKGIYGLRLVNSASSLEFKSEITDTFAFNKHIEITKQFDISSIDSELDGWTLEGYATNLYDMNINEAYHNIGGNEDPKVIFFSNIKIMFSDNAITKSVGSSSYATVSQIPTKTSNLVNDSGYITKSDITIPTKVSDLDNDKGYITNSALSSYVTTSTVPFKFGIDSNGNYGYIKAGADTVIPFNQLKEFTFNVNASNSYSTGTIHIGSITSPGSVSCGWTVSSVTNYIQFTTTAKELWLYGIMTFQTNSSYTHTFSVNGCSYEILENCPSNPSGGRWAKMHLYGITSGSTITLNCYTSYSAVSGIGYLIYQTKY